MSPVESAAPRRTNRRLTARRACHLHSAYRQGAGSWHPATAMDVSPRGCRLRLGEELDRARSVQLRFTAPAGVDVTPRQVEVPGEVVWSRLEGLSFQAGLHFPTESAELAELLADLS